VVVLIQRISFRSCRKSYLFRVAKAASDLDTKLQLT
jgi:hypothetical protein